jgi:hypothetical protein
MVRTTVVGMVFFFAAASAGDFYVAPDGKDDNPGTEQAPFASLERSRDAVCQLVRGGLQGDIAVFVRGGTYTVEKPLAFGPEDSGTVEYAVTYAAYPGEKPVISGGRTITGWQKADDGLWRVELPDVKDGRWRFRQLFRDGVRLPRGRFPNEGTLLTVEKVSADVRDIMLSEPLPVGNLAGRDAELVMYQNWSISREPIVGSDGKTVRVATPMGWIGHGDATTASPGKPAYVENVVEFVDQPGEWCLDRRTGVLTYKAEEGEDPNARRFVAPKAEQLIVVRGRAEAPVRNVRFVGLALEHTEWSLPEFGYLGIQAGHHGTTMKERFHVLPLAIEFVHAEGCELRACSIAHMGACGVGFGAGCRYNHVADCELSDIGGNGIMVGWRGSGEGGALAGDESLSADWNDPAHVPIGIEVVGNVVRACGAVNHGCVGIFDAFSADTKIVHNLVTDMPYTGISVGFRWDESPTSQRGCLVEYNHIHDVMKMLADGGGIYTLGLQPGTVLRGNLIYDVHRSAFAYGGAPNNGIFFDQGSKGFLVEGNVIYNTSGDPIRFNQTVKENFLWKDNAFGIAPGAPGFPEQVASQAGPPPR